MLLLKLLYLILFLIFFGFIMKNTPAPLTLVCISFCFKYFLALSWKIAPPPPLALVCISFWDHLITSPFPLTGVRPPPPPPPSKSPSKSISETIKVGRNIRRDGYLDNSRSLNYGHPEVDEHPPPVHHPPPPYKTRLDPFIKYLTRSIAAPTSSRRAVERLVFIKK